MPIYEYHCRGCDESFEELVRSATEPVACPSCAGAKVERAAAFGFQLAGRYERHGRDGRRLRLYAADLRLPLRSRMKAEG